MKDVLIIGSGPAGLSAALICRKWNLNVLVIDEFTKAGGRLLGQLHQEPNGAWWNGIQETKRLMKKAASYTTDVRNGVSCYNIENIDDYYAIYTNQGVFYSKNILIATGAAEIATPVPGWTVPGVMSIGAAQVMTNVHRVRVGQRGIIIGANVLSAAIARELQLANVDLHSMLLPANNKVNNFASKPQEVMKGLIRIAHLAPSLVLRIGSKFAKSNWVQKLALKFYPKNGIKMWGMPIHLRKAVTSINGFDKVESVSISKIKPDGSIVPNTEEKIKTDFVCIAGGLYPLAELAALIGCSFKYSEELGGHVPVHNEQMETELDGVFVAGNITGIESSKVAMAQGEVAGLSIIRKIVNDPGYITKQLKKSIENVHEVRKNASIQFHPNILDGKSNVYSEFEKYSTK